AMRLIDAGVAAIDVAGAGGTSWSQVEYYRAPSAFHAQVAKAFADWGIPTEKSIRMVRQEAPENFHIFASGGLRTGIDVAKCISLGADLGGMAGPFLRAADQGEDALDEAIRVIIAQLKITMMCTGVADIAELKETPVLPINV
ncbi:MAG: alpha-hydroxy-acid oxidizing protein, partial [Anaerolineae bacterium]